MIESLLLYFTGLPLFAKVIVGFLAFGLILSIVKKLLKIAILIAVLIAVVLFIMRMI